MIDIQDVLQVPILYGSLECIFIQVQVRITVGVLGDGSQEINYWDADVGDFGSAQKFGESFAEVERDVVASGVRGCHID